MLIESNLLPTLSCTQSRDLQVEEVLAWVIIELSSKIRFSFRDFNEWILPLICVPFLECVDQFSNSIL